MTKVFLAQVVKTSLRFSVRIIWEEFFKIFTFQYMNVFASIKTLLDERNVKYKLIHHEPTYTAKESAKAWQEDLKIGGKALVMKIKGEFRVFVLSSALKLNSKAIKKYFDEKELRFATSEELQTMAGLVPGSVPPFGQPILPFKLYIDNSIYKSDKIAFNVGSLTDSIIMNLKDYLEIIASFELKPTFFDFSG